MRETARDFWMDETGMGTVEIILIIVVLIGQAQEAGADRRPCRSQKEEER